MMHALKIAGEVLAWTAGAVVLFVAFVFAALCLPWMTKDR